MPRPQPSQSPDPPAPTGFFRALRYPNFRLFFFGQGFSLIGTWMQQVALQWLVYSRTGSSFKLGLVGFASQLPMLLVTPLAGVYADRWDRHRILVVTQTLLMIEAFALAALVLTDTIAYWQIIPLNLLVGCINAFEMPARQSYFISMIGRREDLGNAIALNSSIVNGTRLIGPTIAGVAIARWGEGVCFLLNGISYWAVLVSLWLMTRVPFVPDRNPKPVFEHMAEGLRYAFGFPPIRAILLLLALVSLVGVPYSILMPVIARDRLGGDAHTYGWLMGAAGLGAFLGAVSLAARRTVLGLGRVMTYSAVLFGVGLIFLAFAGTIWMAMPFLVLTGFAMISTLAACNTVLQTLVEDRMRGRIMSLYAMAFMGVLPFGSLAAGGLASRLGAPLTLGLGGVLCLAAAVLFGLYLESMRELVRPIYVEKGILPADSGPGH